MDNILSLIHFSTPLLCLPLNFNQIDFPHKKQRIQDFLGWWEYENESKSKGTPLSLSGSCRGTTGLPVGSGKHFLRSSLSEKEAEQNQREAQLEPET